MLSNEEKQVVDALKSIARNQQIKTHIQNSPELYPLLFRAAKRFVTGETRKEGIEQALHLTSKGYMVSLEYIGENTSSKEECIHTKNEFYQLIDEIGNFPNGTISLDLSHIGLSVNQELAYDHLIELADKTQQNGLNIMISMEESTKTEKIIEIYKKAAKQYSNIGITIQAHLNRSMKDLEELIKYPGKIRIVKGAYQESSDIAIPRSDELNKRFIDMVGTCIKSKHPVSIATHDEEILNQIMLRGYIDSPLVESEMLFGVRPDLLKDLKDRNHKTRVYLTYGSEWYLYLCHRLAEYPQNIFVAIADIIDPSRTKKSLY